jgi:glutamate mutase epsilon subunit
MNKRKKRRKIRKISVRFSEEFLKQLDMSIEDALKGHYSKSNAKEFLKELEGIENENKNLDNK